MSPLYRGETYCFSSHRSFLCHISFVSVRSIFSVYHAGGQTRDVDPMSGYCWPTVYDAEPTLAQYWVTVSCLTPRWMWASITDGGPTLTQLLLQPAWSRPTDYGWMDTSQHRRRWPNIYQRLGRCRLALLTRSSANTGVELVLVLCWASVADGGLELDQHWVNISYLLGVLTGHICVLHIRVWRY